jgi:hypothetical protein
VSRKATTGNSRISNSKSLQCPVISKNTVMAAKAATQASQFLKEPPRLPRLTTRVTDDFSVGDDLQLAWVAAFAAMTQKGNRGRAVLLNGVAALDR